MSDVKERLGALPFVIGGLSFIPLLGIPFGLIALAWAMFSKKPGRKKLAMVGASGIGCSFLLYGSLFYFGFVQTGGVYDDLRVKLAQSSLNSLVPAIELYRLQHGAYPESLEELLDSWPKDSLLFIYDPSSTAVNGGPQHFHYARDGADHYYLRGVGADRQPFTADDILPQVGASSDKIGLLISSPSK